VVGDVVWGRGGKGGRGHEEGRACECIRDR
jgi:hypothetical protein